jgi:hypothetical protein
VKIFRAAGWAGGADAGKAGFSPSNFPASSCAGGWWLCPQRHPAAPQDSRVVECQRGSAARTRLLLRSHSAAERWAGHIAVNRPAVEKRTSYETSATLLRRTRTAEPQVPGLRQPVESGEQLYLRNRGHTPPHRCKPCREKRKLEREGWRGGQKAKT